MTIGLRNATVWYTLCTGCAACFVASTMRDIAAIKLSKFCWKIAAFMELARC